MKLTPLSMEYCQVSPTSKSLIVIVLLLVMPSLFDEPVSMKKVFVFSSSLEDGTQIVYFYGEQSIVSTESSAVSTDDQSFLDVVTSNIEIVAAIVDSNNVVKSTIFGGQRN
jgi:hypothetical protein